MSGDLVVERGMDGNIPTLTIYNRPALRFTVPLPPSTNALYVYAGKRRIKSAAYDTWLERAGWTVKAQLPKPVEGRVRVLIEAPLNLRRDIDNAQKPVLDLMVKLGLIGDDRLVDDLRIVRTKGGEMVVSVWPL